MSNCLKYEELISAMTDGQLTAAEEKELMDHIAECASCKKMYETYKEIFSSFDGVMQEAPAELKENVMSAISDPGAGFSPVSEQKSSVKGKAKRVWVKYAAIAACFVLIVAAVPSLFSGSKSSAPESAGKSDGVYDMVADEPAGDIPASTVPESEPAPEASEPEAPELPEGDSMSEFPAEEPESDVIIDSTGSANDVPRDEPAADEPMTEESNVCLIYINGILPEILANETLIDNGNGSFNIYIAPDTAFSLINSGYDVKYTSSPDAPIDQHIVIYTP